jgi:hypothetical protein
VIRPEVVDAHCSRAWMRSLGGGAAARPAARCRGRGVARSLSGRRGWAASGGAACLGGVTGWRWPGKGTAMSGLRTTLGTVLLAQRLLGDGRAVALGLCSPAGFRRGCLVVRRVRSFDAVAWWLSAHRGVRERMRVTGIRGFSDHASTGGAQRPASGANRRDDPVTWRTRGARSRRRPPLSGPRVSAGSGPGGTARGGWNAGPAAACATHGRARERSMRTAGRRLWRGHHGVTRGRIPGLWRVPGLTRGSVILQDVLRSVRAPSDAPKDEAPLGLLLVGSDHQAVRSGLRSEGAANSRWAVTAGRGAANSAAGRRKGEERPLLEAPAPGVYDIPTPPRGVASSLAA